MKHRYILLLLTASLAWSQTNPAPDPQAAPPQPGQTAAHPASGLKARGPEVVAAVDPDRVVATINGEKVTAQEAAKMLKYISPEQRKQADTNPNGIAKAVEGIFITLSFAKEAEKLHMDDAPPYKDELMTSRASILSHAYLQYLTTQNFKIEEADIEKAYKDHIADYEQMKLAGIFVSYVAAGAKPPANGKARTAEEAKARAEELVKKVQAGADFAALAKTDSDEPNSAAKGGEMGTFPASKKFPEPINSAVVKLKKGEVSEPIDQHTGYWILYMTDRIQQSYAQARQNVLDAIHRDHANEVMQATLKQYAIQVQDNDFFSVVKPEQKSTTAPAIPSLNNPPSK